MSLWDVWDWWRKEVNTTLHLTPATPPDPGTPLGNTTNTTHLCQDHIRLLTSKQINSWPSWQFQSFKSKTISTVSWEKFEIGFCCIFVFLQWHYIGELERDILMTWWGSSRLTGESCWSLLEPMMRLFWYSSTPLLPLMKILHWTTVGMEIKLCQGFKFYHFSQINFTLHWRLFCKFLTIVEGE